jgi:hypothetical protein
MMTMENVVQLVGEQLFAEDGSSVFAVLDGASVSELLQKLDEHKPDYECLYRGELAPDMAEVAPYLIRLEPDSEFTEWVIGEGWGNHWGVFAVARADLRSLRQHFRRFLMVHDEEGKPLYFRYYDPRVLRVYLPTCNGEELNTIFGPVAAYILEGEKPDSLLRFEAPSGSLVRKEKQLSK